VLITLMLALALVMIALLAALPDLKQQIRRDREEELRHRGTAYMRAIQHFYRKFGRYPSRVEELENTNNIRFLRKHYTDPMSRDSGTGKEKDFKLLHQADVALNNGPVLPGQNGVGGQGGLTAQRGVGAQTGDASGQTSENGDPGDASSSGNPNASGNSNSPGSSSSNSDAGSNSGLGFNGPTFGGGPILGVASTSKAKTIRVFFSKDHYNDWLFIYVQGMDRGGQLMGPVNPSLPTANLESLPNTGQTQVVPQPQQNPGPTPPQQ
jgi:type II secretory pathway pseudopilin PulG